MNRFTVNCTVCPEHKVRATNCRVQLKVDEDKDDIISVHCFDCAAANGGCKHGIAFLMWLYRRNEEPACTEVLCYWKKSVLATVGTTTKFIKASEFRDVSKSSSYTTDAKNDFLCEFLDTARNLQLDLQFTRYYYEVKEREIMSLSIHKMIINFVACGKTSAADFAEFAKTILTSDLCKLAELSTRFQSSSLLWHELRYGRITASNLYQAAHCGTQNGSLVRLIFGAAKVFENEYMKRGKELESKVLQVFQKKTNMKCRNSGILLLPQFPMFGASPDAIGEDFTVEIKCPAKEKTVANYFHNGKISQKCKAQMQLQMLATKTEKGYLCIAKPNFEETGEIEIHCEIFDEAWTNEIIAAAHRFWEECIFPRLLSSCKT